MRSIIARKYALTWATGGTTYIYSDPVPPGKILHAHSVCARSEQRDASDDAEIGHTDAGTKIVLTSKATLAAAFGITNEKDFYVGEGDKIFANFPDAENNDVLELHVNGVLEDLAEWIKGTE